jgi:hypothetical protein
LQTNGPEGVRLSDIEPRFIVRLAVNAALMYGRTSYRPDGNHRVKFAESRPCADPEKAARRLLEIASTVEPIHDGRIHVEKINGPFLREASPAEYGAALAYAIDQGWLWKHELGTFVRFTQSGAELFA